MNWKKAEDLERWLKQVDEARAELDAAMAAGLDYMNKHDNALPPAEMQERVERAHKRFLEVNRRNPNPE
jgi:hypothetical protein